MASGRLSPSRLSSSNISALLSDDPSAVGAHFEELLSAAVVVLEGEDGSAGAASRHASNSSADAHRPGPLGTLPRSGLGSSPPPPQRLSAGAMRRPRY